MPPAKQTNARTRADTGAERRELVTAPSSLARNIGNILFLRGLTRHHFPATGFINEGKVEIPAMRSVEADRESVSDRSRPRARGPATSRCGARPEDNGGVPSITAS
jgi:hypothetical protein